ncbi:MAG: hypothetical protein H6649_04390 [Caldilineae bacterium]|nr:hypothetical protein [Anaerolineae bacterium]MCB9153278.1 hypothetical protein [Caldilineae bacterium]
MAGPWKDRLFPQSRTFRVSHIQTFNFAEKVERRAAGPSGQAGRASAVSNKEVSWQVRGKFDFFRKVDLLGYRTSRRSTLPKKLNVAPPFLTLARSVW